MTTPGDTSSTSPTTPGCSNKKEKRRSFLPTRKSRSPQGSTSEASDDSKKTPDLHEGARVCLGGVKEGALRYIGKTQFAEGEWCGIELDDPEGKHNGTVDGVLYFNCASNRGIFAPRDKVDLIANWETSSDSTTVKTPSPSSETAKLKQRRHSGLPQPTYRRLSTSPEPKRAKTTSESETSDVDLSPVAGSARSKSRLVRPKAIKREAAQGSTPSSSRESSASREPTPAKPSKLPLGGAKTSIPKLGTLRKKQHSQGSTCSSKSGRSAASAASASSRVFGETFILDSLDHVDKHNADHEDLDPFPPPKSSQSSRLVDASGSAAPPPLDRNHDLNQTFVLDTPNGNSLDTLTLQSQPLPDLLTPPGGQDLYAVHKEDGDEQLLAADDVEADVLAHSRASSLGILTDQDLYNNSLVSSSIGILTDQELCNNSLLPGYKEEEAVLMAEGGPKDSIDLPEKEIDQEIAGISTPEIDLSSGKEVASSPEPDVVRHMFDLSFDLKPGQTSTPASPAKTVGAARSAGEKMATPDTEKAFGANTKGADDVKQQQNNANTTFNVDKAANATYNLIPVEDSDSNDREIEPMDVDHVQVNRTYNVPPVQRRLHQAKICTDSSDDSDEYPKRMRTSADLDEVDIDLMSASFELARTAVAQYADLVKGSEVKRDTLRDQNDQSKLDKELEPWQGRLAHSGDSNSGTSDSDSERLSGLGREPIALDLIKDSELLVNSPQDSSVQPQPHDGVHQESVQIEDVVPKVMIASGHAIDLGDSETSSDNFLGSVDSLEEVGTKVAGGQGHIDLEESDQLIADLQEGHRRTERPTSMISSCSADTGILADGGDSSGDSDRKERPVSLISTSSVDTGYQPDTDTEPSCTLTANSPLANDAPPFAAPPPDDAEGGGEAHPPPQGYGSLEEAYTDTFQRFQKAVMKGTIHAAESMGSDSNLSFYSSDGGTVVAGSETERDDSDMDETHPAELWMDRKEDEWTRRRPGERMEEESGEESGTEDITVEEVRVTSPEDMEGVCELDSPDSQQRNPQDHHHPADPENPAPADPEPRSPSLISGLLNPTDASIPSIMLQQPSPLAPEQGFPEVSEQDTTFTVPPSGEDKTQSDSTFVVREDEEDHIASKITVDSMDSVDSASAKSRFNMEDLSRMQGQEETMEVSCTSELRSVEMETAAREPHPEAATESASTTAVESPPDTAAESTPETAKEQPPESSKTGAKSGTEKRAKKNVSSTPEKKAKVAKKTTTSSAKDDIKSKTASPRLQVKSAKDSEKGAKGKLITRSRESTPTRSPQRKASISGKKTETAVDKTPKTPVRRVSKASVSVPKATPSATKKPAGKDIETKPSSSDKDVARSPARRPSKTSSSLKLGSFINKKPPPGDTSTANIKQKKEVTNSGKKKAEILSDKKAATTTTTLDSLAEKTASKLSQLDLGSSQKNIVVNPVISKGVGETPKKTTAVKSEKQPRSRLEKELSQIAAAGKEKTLKVKPVVKQRAESAKRVASLAGSRTPSTQSLTSSKPANRLTQSLRKRERSGSIESDSQASCISQVSSQGSRPSTSSWPGRRGKESTPEPAKRVATKRSSVVEGIRAPKLAAGIEPRRASVAVTTASRLTTPARLAKPPTSLSATSSPKRTQKDQNRNKTVKSTVSLKRSANQPDVVTNSIGGTQAAQEISRLEALCEARTKELNYSKLQLRKQAEGFEAMTVLVQYLTQELNAFSCPAITAKLEESKVQLGHAQDHLVELTKQRDALIAEIQCLKQQHQEELDRLETDHQGALRALEQRLNRERDEEIQRVNAEHEQAVSSLKASHEKELLQQERHHAQDKEDADFEFQRVLSKHEQDNEDRLADLQKQHTTQLEEITMRFQGIKLTLSQKVDMLRNECEEMRQREKVYMAACQRDADLKVQMALAPYRHLPQEIDSLKAVMELRNQEIHQLRRQKGELERQLEELPKAREKIKGLDQKLENLEAIIDIKADYERQLSEKHQVLLRRYDRESKANKRLSMDKEELSWRLSQSDFGSPDVLRRSLNHSPTNSETSTPEHHSYYVSPGGVKLRHPPKRQNLHSPRSPRDLASDFEDRSPTHQNNGAFPKTNLKRSGTYELLNQDVDEEEDLKQSDV